MGDFADGSDGCRRIKITYEELDELLVGRKVLMRIDGMRFSNVLVKYTRFGQFFLSPTDFKMSDDPNHVELLHKAIELEFDGREYYYQGYTGKGVIVKKNRDYTGDMISFFFNTNLPGEWKRLIEFERRKEREKINLIKHEIKDHRQKIIELEKELG